MVLDSTKGDKAVPFFAVYCSMSLYHTWYMRMQSTSIVFALLNLCPVMNLCLVCLFRSSAWIVRDDIVFPAHRSRIIGESISASSAARIRCLQAWLASNL